ncbi:hypothetical protein FTX61_13130 [Nitriliruptoraceae bacterium ZYF776]|nr:hypothetical protein [Profundirhabdus halotolerans]
MVGGRRARFVALVVAGIVAASSVVAPLAVADEVLHPTVDPFYVPPEGFETAQPGDILRRREVTVSLRGLPFGVGEALQLQYRTTHAQGDPSHTVATVLVPDTPWQGPGPRPLVSHQEPINALGAQCVPSYLLRKGEDEDAAAQIALMLARGWVVVVPDHEGPRHAYAAGLMAGHATLDGVRAALASGAGGLTSDSPVAFGGYSGGAIATGWAAELHPTYAPELHAVGFAVGGTPSDYELMGRYVERGPFTGIFIGAAIGLLREYPDKQHILNDRGREAQERLAEACVAEMALTYPFASFADFTVSDDPFRDPEILELVTENRLGAGAPTAPVFLHHGLLDEGVPYQGAVTLRDEWCANGAQVRLVTGLVTEHLLEPVLRIPEVLAFFGGRFAGDEPSGFCVPASGDTANDDGREDEDGADDADPDRGADPDPDRGADPDPAAGPGSAPETTPPAPTPGTGGPEAGSGTADGEGRAGPGSTPVAARPGAPLPVTGGGPAPWSGLLALGALLVAVGRRRHPRRA